MKSKAAIIRAFILAGGITATGLMSGVYLAKTAYAAGSDPYRSLDTLANAIHHVQAHYLSEMDTTDLVYGAIDGLMDALDDHSRFLDPNALAANEARTEGVYVGIGVEMKMDAGSVVVYRTVPDSPADGVLEPGDRIIAIDNEETAGLSDASEALKGDAESTVTIKFQRAQQTTEARLTRARIRDKTVRVNSLGKGWSIAEISRFQRNTATDLAQALRQAKPKRGLIIDLRGNGGGLLDEAIDVVDLFASSGMIVQTRGRGGTVLERHDASSDAPYSTLQLIVLIDGESASASEIVAGSLRSLAGAQLVGTRSFGKWSVQRVYVFEDKSAIKLTVAQYEIVNAEPSGLQPDVYVEQATAHSDAISGLQKRLQGDTEALNWLNKLTESIQEDVAPPPLGPLRDRITQDPQLAAAWTLALANH